MTETREDLIPPVESLEDLEANLNAVRAMLAVWRVGHQVKMLDEALAFLEKHKDDHAQCKAFAFQ